MKVERQFYELVQLYARQHLPAAVFEQLRYETHLDLMNGFAEDLVMQMLTVVIGKTGQEAKLRRHVIEAKFPRYVPRWLRRRWSQPKTICLDATPLLIYPYAENVPKQLGRAVEIFRLHEYDE